MPAAAVTALATASSITTVRETTTCATARTASTLILTPAPAVRIRTSPLVAARTARTGASSSCRKRRSAIGSLNRSTARRPCAAARPWQTNTAVRLAPPDSTTTPHVRRWTILLRHPMRTGGCGLPSTVASADRPAHEEGRMAVIGSPPRHIGAVDLGDEAARIARPRRSARAVVRHGPVERYELEHRMPDRFRDEDLDR